MGRFREIDLAVVGENVHSRREGGVLQGFTLRGEDLQIGSEQNRAIGILECWPSIFQALGRDLGSVGGDEHEITHDFDRAHLIIAGGYGEFYVGLNKQ